MKQPSKITDYKPGDIVFFSDRDYYLDLTYTYGIIITKEEFMESYAAKFIFGGKLPDKKEYIFYKTYPGGRSKAFKRRFINKKSPKNKLSKNPFKLSKEEAIGKLEQLISEANKIKEFLQKEGN